MRIIHDLKQAHPTSRSYVTIGVFDGVHRGHQQLIGGMAQAAHAAESVAAVITFDPHPSAALGYDPPPLLTTVEERVDLLAALGLDLLAVLPFTPEMARTPAADFAEPLIQRLRLAELWGGPDFAFGHRREGDAPFLRRLGAKRGFGVRVVAPLVWEGKPVNSSRVRAALEAGDIPQATGCLGRPYCLTSNVVRGRGEGRKIGAPTANLAFLPERLIPARGVYACRAHTARQGAYPAVVNVGTRPTFEGSGLVVEAHLLDFDGNLYGQTLALDFVARLRDEIAFPSVKALATQIQEDIAQARAIIRRQKPSQHSPGHC
ncbi:MAG TPA: bifunctional riboflavin kinase/FAD synthetase [Thermoflexia bacterium]|nr:bifunctional riboflavin kinase/FAD synthetase [Thermoflexia bacterium]